MLSTQLETLNILLAFQNVAQHSVYLIPFQTDKSGRLKLETVDDLFNILKLRKRRRERKVQNRKEPEPEIIVRPATIHSTQSFSPSFFKIPHHNQGEGIQCRKASNGLKQVKRY